MSVMYVGVQTDGRMTEEGVIPMCQSTYAGVKREDDGTKVNNNNLIIIIKIIKLLLLLKTARTTT